jgi:hypothetical protein
MVTIGHDGQCAIFTDHDVIPGICRKIKIAIDSYVCFPYPTVEESTDHKYSVDSICLRLPGLPSDPWSTSAEYSG